MYFFLAAVMHHGEALVIRGDSYRMKDNDNDGD
jgi:hypothetical protein